MALAVLVVIGLSRLAGRHDAERVPEAHSSAAAAQEIDAAAELEGPWGSESALATPVRLELAPERAGTEAAALGVGGMEPGPASTGARLLVVLLANGEPAAEGRVRITSNGVSRTGDVDPRLEGVVFEGLEPGADVVVRVTACPPKFLAPREQLLRTERELRLGLRAGETRLELELTSAAHLWGELTFEGVVAATARANVRCSPRPGSPAEEYAPVDLVAQEGRFSAFLPPGEWRIEATLGRGSMPASAVGVAEPRLGMFPPPTRLEVLEAGTSTRIDLRYVRGTLALRGRVVDEAGVPIVGVPVTVSRLELVESARTGEAADSARGLLRVDTDAEGRFEARGLVAARYRVLVAPDCCHPLAAPGENSVARTIPALEVRLGAGDDSAPLEFVAARSRTMRARGRVLVDPAWALRHGVTGMSPGVRVVLGTSKLRSKETSYDVALREGEFEFWLEAQETAALVVELAGELVTYPLFLVPHDAPGGSPQILSFP